MPILSCYPSSFRFYSLPSIISKRGTDWLPFLHAIISPFFWRPTSRFDFSFQDSGDHEQTTHTILEVPIFKVLVFSSRFSPLLTHSLPFIVLLVVLYYLLDDADGYLTINRQLTAFYHILLSYSFTSSCLVVRSEGLSEVIPWIRERESPWCCPTLDKVSTNQNHSHQWMACMSKHWQGIHSFQEEITMKMTASPGEREVETRQVTFSPLDSVCFSIHPSYPIMFSEKASWHLRQRKPKSDMKKSLFTGTFLWSRKFALSIHLEWKTVHEITWWLGVHLPFNGGRWNMRRWSAFSSITRQDTQESCKSLPWSWFINSWRIASGILQKSGVTSWRKIITKKNLERIGLSSFAYTEWEGKQSDNNIPRGHFHRTQGKCRARMIAPVDSLSKVTRGVKEMCLPHCLVSKPVKLDDALEITRSLDREKHDYMFLRHKSVCLLSPSHFSLSVSGKMMRSRKESSSFSLRTIVYGRKGATDGNERSISLLPVVHSSSSEWIVNCKAKDSKFNFDS